MLWFKHTPLLYLRKMVIYIFRLHQVHQNSWCWRWDNEKHSCIVLLNYIQYITQQGPREGHRKLSFYYRRINHYGSHTRHGILVGISNEIWVWELPYFTVWGHNSGWLRLNHQFNKIITQVTMVLSHQSSEQKMSREAGFITFTVLVLEFIVKTGQWSSLSKLPASSATLTW